MKDKLDTPVFIVFLVGAFVFACITFVLGIWVCDSSHKIDKQLTDVKMMDNYSDDSITADDLFKEEFTEAKDKISTTSGTEESKVNEIKQGPNESIENNKKVITQSDLIKKNNEIKKNKEKSKKVETNKSKSNKKPGNTTKKNIVKKINKKKNEKPIVSSKRQYYIQIIATSKKTIAESEKNKFERKGYNVFVVPEKKGKSTIYKVRIGTFKTKEQAKKIAAKIAKEFKIKPWVL